MIQGRPTLEGKETKYIELNKYQIIVLAYALRRLRNHSQWGEDRRSDPTVSHRRETV